MTGSSSSSSSRRQPARLATPSLIVNLGRLKDCLSVLTGGDGLVGPAVVETTGHLVDLPDLARVGGRLTGRSHCELLLLLGRRGPGGRGALVTAAKQAM